MPRAGGGTPGPFLHPEGISQPGEVRGRAPLPAGVSGAPGRLQKEAKPPKKNRAAHRQHLRLSGVGDELCSELGFGFIFNLSKPPGPVVATRSEISHRTQTVLGEPLPKGRGDARRPQKKTPQRGRIQHGNLGSASSFHQAEAHAAFYRPLAHHTEGKKPEPSFW